MTRPLIIAMLTASLAPMAAQAQDVVVMRRTIAPPNRAAATQPSGPARTTTCDMPVQDRVPNDGSGNATLNRSVVIVIIDTRTQPLTAQLVKDTCETNRSGVGMCLSIPYGSSSPTLHEIRWIGALTGISAASTVTPGSANRNSEKYASACR